MISLLTAAYLLALAIKKQGRLVTFDKAISVLLAKNDPQRKAIYVIES